MRCLISAPVILTMKHSIVTVLVSFAVLSAMLCVPVVRGGVESEAPSRVYFAKTLPSFYRGNFNETLNHLNRNLRDAIRIEQTNQQVFLWLDSLCYWTLKGECHFQMVQHDEALLAYTTALKIYLDHSDWLCSISISAKPKMRSRESLPWGASSRTGNVGDFSQCRFKIDQDYFNIVPIANQGEPNRQTLTDIHADHIVRCLALAIRRRAEILGSLSQTDSEMKTLAEVLASRPHLPNHFAASWVDVLYGLVLSAMKDDNNAEIQLTKGLLMMGEFDHQLTAVALNELGHIALRNENPKVARTHYLEASIAAYRMGNDPVLLGETFRNMANAHRLTHDTLPFPSIIAATDYFRASRNVSPLTLLPLMQEKSKYSIAPHRIDVSKKARRAGIFSSSRFIDCFRRNRSL